MSEVITQEANPTLWSTLHDAYVADGEPRNVVLGALMYKAYAVTSGEIVFTEVSAMDYIDSRSITGSRKAFYSKMKE